MDFGPAIGADLVLKSAEGLTALVAVLEDGGF